jgi:hypothetical protein
MRTVSPTLLQRLRELALVQVDILVGALAPAVALEVLGAYVADLEDALGQARSFIKEAHAELAAGADPLNLLDQGPQRRMQGGDELVDAVSARVRARAFGRRELARLEDLVRGVLPRLLEADRRFIALGGQR